MEQSLKEKIVELREQGLTYDEIAEQTGTYKSKIHRILSAVPNTLQDDETEWNEEEQEDGTEWNDMEQEMETLRNNFGTLEQKVEQEIGTLQRNFETLQKNFEKLQNKAGFMEQEQKTEVMEQENGTTQKTTMEQNGTSNEDVLKILPKNVKNALSSFIGNFRMAYEVPSIFTKGDFEVLKQSCIQSIHSLMFLGESLRFDVFKLELFQLLIRLHFSLFVLIVHEEDSDTVYEIAQDIGDISITQNDVEIFKRLYSLIEKKEYVKPLEQHR